MRRGARSMGRAGATGGALLSVAGARSGAVERVRRRGEESKEGAERRARENAPAVYGAGARGGAAEAGYVLPGRALAEPELT
jgi:hypothetical protein